MLIILQVIITGLKKLYLIQNQNIENIIILEKGKKENIQITGLQPLLVLLGKKLKEKMICIISIYILNINLI